MGSDRICTGKARLKAYLAAKAKRTKHRLDNTSGKSVRPIRIGTVAMAARSVPASKVTMPVRMVRGLHRVATIAAAKNRKR